MHRLPCLAALLATLASVNAHAADAIASCAAIHEDRERLACYDRVAATRDAAVGNAVRRSAACGEPTSDVRDSGSVPSADNPSYLTRRWQLTPALHNGVLKLDTYRSQYILVHATDNINQHPQSPTRGPDTSDVELQRLEAKLQLSFRTKLVEDGFHTGTDAWFAYTQQSYWQAANGRYSSPFRETNYEPEVIVLHALPFAAGPVRMPYAAVSFTHQSNGRGQTLSRSWNRIIADLPFESGAWSVHVRPWARAFDASGERDDNPDIEDYIGRGEIVAEYRPDTGQVVTFRGRHSLRGGDRAHGSAQVDWAVPLAGKLNGHVQLFSGYGESLIDYNHNQTTVGVGLSFAD